METLGQRLRAEREKRGLTIEQLAAQLRINVRYFEAIEADDTSRLPGGFFYRSFVRQYARTLGLPESAYMGAIQRSLEAEAEELDARETVLPDRKIDVPPMPTGKRHPGLEARRWAIRISALVVVLVLATGAYWLWQQWRTPAVTVGDGRPPATRGETTAQQPESSGGTVRELTPPADTAQGQPPSESPVQPPPMKETPKAVEPGTAASAATPAAQAQRVEAGASAPVRLVVRASEDAWVQAVGDGRVQFSDVMRTGEIRAFSAARGIRLRIGNAGGVSIEYNGQPQPAPGARGQVITLDFTPEGARVVQPPKPETAPPPGAASGQH